MNTLDTLAKTMMDQLSVINDKDISVKDLNKEIARADAMTKISKEIIANANLQYKASVQYASKPQNRTAPNILRLENE